MLLIHKRRYNRGKSQGHYIFFSNRLKKNEILEDPSDSVGGLECIHQSTAF